MTRYRSKDILDDGIITDNDSGFFGFETRRHATELEQGITQFAQNIRFDEQVGRIRKGIDRISDDIFVAGDPLILPFQLAVSISVTSITRSGTTATVTLASTPVTPYVTGDTVEIIGAVETDYNGEFVITVLTTTTFTYTVAGSPSTPATGTITAENHPVLGDPADGVFASTLFSDVDTDNEYIALATLDKVVLVDPDDPTSTIDIPYKEETSAEEQFEQTDNGDIIQVNNGLVIHRGKLKKALEWDGNIFNTDAKNVDSITRSGTTATVTTTFDHTYETNDLVDIAGAVESDYNGQFEIIVTGVNTFTYTVSGSPTTPATGTITATKVPQFEVIADTELAGFLSMPQAEFCNYHPFARLIVPVRVIFLDVSSLTRSGAVATVTTTLANHGLLVGDRFEITGAAAVEYNGIHSISEVTGANTFTFTVQGLPATPDSGATIQIKIDVRDQFIVSDIFDHRTYDQVNNLFRINRGFSDRLVAFQVYQNDLLVVLFRKSIHLVTGLSAANLDESNVFQVTDEVGCIARRTVQLIGDKIVFLSEQGVYLIQITPELNLRGVDVPLSKDIEDEIRTINRAVAGDSVAIYFNNRYYLAVPEGERIITNGTVTTDGATVTINTLTNHGFNEGDEIAMAGMTPAGFNDTAAVITLVDRNTFTYANATSGPITVAGTSTKAASTRNNIVYIYNFLNGRWESKDTFGAEGSFVDNWVVAEKDGKDRLFGTSLEGALQLWEELDHDEIGPVGGPFVTTEIPGQMITRIYNGSGSSGLFDTKKWAKGSIDFEVLDADAFSVTANTENPDSTVLSASYGPFSGDEDHFRSFRINKRGRGVAIQLDTSAGRPEFRRITVQGTTHQRANKNFE